MSPLMQKISRFLSSPQGQRMVARGRQELAKPGTQQKIRGLAAKFGKRR
ncbi:hypothetical protein O7606_09370 [Micromonospora sp. WMMD882]|nr:hypothetical protein [Micromonospora sp. WMMD882]WBB81542.1 hypothetical protein O7606_09370 [Micromonospora sp. WMMD882]